MLEGRVTVNLYERLRLVMNKSTLVKLVVVILSVITTGLTYAASVPLIWDYTDNSENPAVSFSMYRDNDCMHSPLFLASVPRSSLEYTDNTAIAGHTYCYTVTALSATGEESSTSNVLMFQVPLPPPNPPSNLRRK